MIAATNALSALAHETRLKVFRLLMRQGPEGLPAMEIAARLHIRPNLMSTHLGALAQSGITTTRRDGRRIYHAVDMEAVRSLLMFLVANCCHGNAEQCALMFENMLGDAA